MRTAIAATWSASSPPRTASKAATTSCSTLPACRRRCVCLCLTIHPDRDADLCVEQNFELNPKHPLIERLLEKVEEAGEDEDALAELKESVTALWYVPLPLSIGPSSRVSRRGHSLTRVTSLRRQTAMLKSQYTLDDPGAYFKLVETMLRRSLGVSQSAEAEVEVKPAPPVETGPPPSEPPPSPADDEALLDELEMADASREPEPAEEKNQWVDWSKVRESVRDGVVDTVKAVVPDLDTDGPVIRHHEEL